MDFRFRVELEIAACFLAVNIDGLLQHVATTERVYLLL